MIRKLVQGQNNKALKCMKVAHGKVRIVWFTVPHGEKGICLTCSSENKGYILRKYF